MAVQTNRGSGDAYVSPFGRTKAVGTPMYGGSDEPRHWGRLCIAVQMNRGSGDAYVSPFGRTEALGTLSKTFLFENEEFGYLVEHFYSEIKSLDAQ